MLRIDSGSTTSTKRVCPRNLRVKRSIDAASAESSAAFTYSPDRKSFEIRRFRPTMISRGTIGRCSLCCDHSHRKLTGSCPVMTGTSEKSSAKGMLREQCQIKSKVATVIAPQTAQTRIGTTSTRSRAKATPPIFLDEGFLWYQVRP
jgi:hypothetical protein